MGDERVEDLAPAISRRSETEVRAPEAEQATDRSSEATGIFDLHGSVGNAAVGQLLSVVGSTHAAGGGTISRRDAPDSDVGPKMVALEQSMNGVQTAAGARATTINTAGDECVTMLNEAKNHLKESNEKFEQGYNTFKGVLERADKWHAAMEAVESAVQGLVVAVGVATALGPLAAGVEGAIGTATLLRTLAANTLNEIGSTLAEAGVNATVDGAQGEAPAPGSTIGGAGPDPGAKYKEAFGHLDRMITTLAAGGFGSAASSQTELALKAADLSKQALKLRVGDAMALDADGLEREGTKLKGIDTRDAAMPQRATSIKTTMQAMRDAVKAVKIEEPTAVEDSLWRVWMANLGSAHEVLDNDVIEKYLGPEGKGMIDFGSYTSDADQEEAVVKAQRDWLNAQGIPTDESLPDHQVKSRFVTQKGLIERRGELIGQTCRWSGHNIWVGGRQFYSPNVTDQEIEGIVLNVVVSPGVLDLNAEASDSDYQVIAAGKPQPAPEPGPVAGAPEAGGSQAPAAPEDDSSLSSQWTP